MGIGDVFNSPQIGEILKAVANPITTAGGAVGGLIKQSGILDEIGKMMDGAVKKPKGGGLSGIAEQIKKMTENMMPPGGVPGGFLDPGKGMPPGYGGGKAGGAAAGVGGKWSAPGYGGGGGSKVSGPGYGGGGGKWSGPGSGGTGNSKVSGPGYGGGGGYGVGSPSGTGGAIGGLATAAQKAIFIATLQKVIQDVASKPNFNMDRAINDVWMQVSMLRAQKAMSEMNEAFGVMERMLKAQHEMAKGIVSNMR